jgi:hypothetical protein
VSTEPGQAQIVNPPPPEPPEEPAPKPRLYVLALGEVEKRIVPNAFQIPEALKSIAPDAEMGARLPPERPAS